MMRKLFLFLILFLLSIIPLASADPASYSTTVGNENHAQINTKLTAGTFTGTFVGFSSTSHGVEGGLKPIAVLNLTLDPDKPDTEIDTMTASGSFYAYWILRNNTTAMNIYLSWKVPDGLKNITVKTVKDGSSVEINNPIATVSAAPSSVVTGSQQISVETDNLLDKTYGASYTIEFTIKAEAQS